MSVIILNLTVLVMCIMSTGCTISFQNISTHGVSKDLVDENQTASPDISATVPAVQM
jgi:hypothetical protein